MTMPMTSFRLLREAGACKRRYRYLAKTLGGIKNYGRDTPITLLQILNICGFDDALWALKACPGSERFARLLACDYAEHVLPAFEVAYPEDNGPRHAIEVARRYAGDEASNEELSAAWDATMDAVHTAKLDAVWPAQHAARAIACAATENAVLTKAALFATVTVCSAESDTELEWQERRLRELLEGEMAGDYN